MTRSAFTVLLIYVLSVKAEVDELCCLRVVVSS